MAAPHIGIAGAGLLGRLLAWALARQGWRVSVFDASPGPEPAFDGQGAAAFSAAGLLSPLAERDVASERIATLGWRSLALWPQICAALPGRPFCGARGSLLLAHRGDLAAAQRLLARLPAGAAQALTAAERQALEPSIGALAHAWLLPGEGQLDPPAVLQTLQVAAGPRVTWHWGRRVAEVRPHRLLLADGRSVGFDAVADLRGLGARPDLPLRGVRGETLWLQLPGHGLARPVRLAHPRHRLYLAPRPGDVIVVGASEIESEDRSPVTLKSALELMSGAHSVLPALQEARILRLDRNLRPALPDHEPVVVCEAGRLQVNGLFRHGWLLAPALLEAALAEWAETRLPALFGEARTPRARAATPGKVAA